MKLLVLFLGLMFVGPPSSVYDFKLKNIDGQDFSLAQYKGKKVLIVNTASKCGFTPQYAELQKLADMYKDKLVVVGFPANNFGQQEPGTATEIKSFCQKNYGVTFPLSEKVSVKGDDICPLFKYLTEAPNPDFTGEIKWNFEKFLIDENGTLIHRFRSKTTPLSPDITKYL
ncbi:MAG TPA: glutathione peroxidase [Mucilaginibacter sp.]|jgi:glutathione peroxidase